VGLGIEGRVAMVAASSQGLGKAVALGLAREGVKLALCARAEPTLKAAADEIRGATGIDVIARQVHVTRHSQVKAFVARSQSSMIFSAQDFEGGPPLAECWA
jgi:3-oxoacyl-[acyl-carrier protein] reductase